MFLSFMPAPETGLVAAELGKVRVLWVPQIASHPPSPRTARLFRPTTLLPGMAGLSLPSAPKPLQLAETMEVEGTRFLGHTWGNSLATL